MGGRSERRVTRLPSRRSSASPTESSSRICELLGREPNDFELAVYSLLWSEHCGYKHSRLLLRRFPTAASASSRARARTPA